MEIILLEDIKNQGKKGDVVEVSDGYAHNFLLPQGKAKPATKEAIKEIRRQEKQKEKKNKEAKDKYKKLDKKEISLFKSGNKKGKLYGSVNKKEIKEKIKEVLGIKIKKEQVQFNQDIQTAGDHKVKVNLADGSTAFLNVSVKLK